MLSQKSAILTGAVMLLAGPASAQMIGPLSVQRQDPSVHVQNNFSFFVPGPNNDSEESGKARDNARRAIYAMAAKECDLLREVLAKDRFEVRDARRDQHAELIREPGEEPAQLAR